MIYLVGLISDDVNPVIYSLSLFVAPFTSNVEVDIHVAVLLMLLYCNKLPLLPVEINAVELVALCIRIAPATPPAILVAV